MTTVGELLAAASSRFAASGIEDSRLEATVLLATVLGVDRTRLLAMTRCDATPQQAAAFETLVDRRSAREPLAYILGHREFFGIDISCGPGVLIPRPETELLVEVALEAAIDGKRVTVADVGTGSGAIAVAVALNAQNARVTAIDRSEAAVAVAAHNVAAHAVQDRVDVMRGDLLAGVGVFDVVLANLPYIPEHEWNALQPEVRDHEPREALLGGADGTDVIRRFLSEAPEHLAGNGVLAMEVGAGQAPTILAAAQASFPEAGVSVIKDLAGIERVVVVRRG